MNKLIQLMVVLIIGLTSIIIAGKVCEITTKAKVAETKLAEIQSYIPNICEIQQKLTEAGYYNGCIDGIWGKETDMAYCNWAAAQHFK